MLDACRLARAWHAYKTDHVKHAASRIQRFSTFFKFSFAFYPFGDKSLQIRGLKDSELYSALYPLLEKSFTGSKESRVFYRLHQERPHAPDWEFSRVGFIDGEMVAHVGIWPFEMQLADGVVLKCGGIRDVCTDPAYRKQRLGHLIFDDASRFMNKKGIDVSVLYAGPRHFYEEKGWHGVIPSYKFMVDLADIDDSIAPAIDLEEMTSYDVNLVDEMCRIRKESSKDLIFVVIRDDPYFHRLIQTDFDFPEHGWTPYIVRERTTGACVGYLLGHFYEPGIMTVVEARVSAGDETAVYQAIFCHLKTRLGCTSLELRLSPNHEICKAAAKLAIIQDYTLPTSGVMVKFVSLELFLTKLVDAINIQIKNGKRENNAQAISKQTFVKLTIRASEDNDESGQEFIIDIDPSQDAVDFLRIIPGEYIRDETCTATISISVEMLVTILFAPSLSANEMIDDGLLHADGVDPAIIELLFRGFSWDKEYRDYF